MTVRGTPVKEIFNFHVKLHPVTGLFQVVEEEKVLVTGRVRVIKRIVENVVVVPQQLPVYLPIRGEEIYQQLKLKGFEVEEELKTLLGADLKCQYGQMLWTGKWVSFLEGLVQLKTFAKRHTTTTFGGIMMPRRIEQLTINPIAHLQYVQQLQQQVLPVVYDRRTKKTVVGGIELVELKGHFVPRIEQLEREVLFQQLQQQQQQPIFFPTYKGFETVEITAELEQLQQEFVQYYVEECKRIAQYIVKKINHNNTTTLFEQEPLMNTNTTVVVRPVSQTLQYLINKINKYERKVYQHLPVLTAIVEQQGFELMQLLKTIVEEIQLVQEQEQVLRRVKYFFGHKNVRFYQTLEQDVILANLVRNVKPHFVQLFKTILEQSVEQLITPCQPWTGINTNTTTIVEPRLVRNNNVFLPEQLLVPTIYEQTLVEQEPRLRLFRSPCEIVLPKYF